MLNPDHAYNQGSIQCRIDTVDFVLRKIYDVITWKDTTHTVPLSILSLYNTEQERTNISSSLKGPYYLPDLMISAAYRHQLFYSHLKQRREGAPFHQWHIPKLEDVLQLAAA